MAFAQTLGINILEVFIYKFEDGVFYSEVVFDDAGKVLRLDSRTSDAIAIALRVGCEIFTTPEIVDECGVVLEDSQKETEEEKSEEESLLDLEPEEIHDAHRSFAYATHQHRLTVDQGFIGQHLPAFGTTTLRRSIAGLHKVITVAGLFEDVKLHDK